MAPFFTVRHCVLRSVTPGRNAQHGDGGRRPCAAVPTRREDARGRTNRLRQTLHSNPSPTRSAPTDTASCHEPWDSFTFHASGGTFLSNGACSTSSSFSKPHIMWTRTSATICARVKQTATACLIDLSARVKQTATACLTDLSARVKQTATACLTDLSARVKQRAPACLTGGSVRHDQSWRTIHYLTRYFSLPATHKQEGPGSRTTRRAVPRSPKTIREDLAPCTVDASRVASLHKSMRFHTTRCNSPLSTTGVTPLCDGNAHERKLTT